jgi:hypothetical protein
MAGRIYGSEGDDLEIMKRLNVSVTERLAGRRKGVAI